MGCWNCKFWEDNGVVKIDKDGETLEYGECTNTDSDDYLREVDDFYECDVWWPI